MNREIKFRAWDKEEKFYRYPTIDDAMMPELGPNGCLELRGQYIGLKDFNGREIYEGDVLIYSRPGKGAAHRRIVQWDKLRARFNVTQIFADHSDIKGNVYENPELLK